MYRNAWKIICSRSTCSCYTSSEDSVREKIEIANRLINRVKETLKIVKTTHSIETIILEGSSDSEKMLIASEPEMSALRQEQGRPYNETKLSDVQHSAMDNDETKQVVLQIKQDVLGKERPKTRRQNQEVDDYVSEKFKSVPVDLSTFENYDHPDYEVLRNKLNTISETTETDDSKASVPSDEQQCRNKGKISSFI